MECSNCHQEIVAGNAFCGACGTAVGEASRLVVSFDEAAQESDAPVAAPGPTAGREPARHAGEGGSGPAVPMGAVPAPVRSEPATPELTGDPERGGDYSYDASESLTAVDESVPPTRGLRVSPPSGWER